MNISLTGSLQGNVAMIVKMNDKAVLEEFLRQDTYLHIYEIGDLDDFFYEKTTWYGWQNADSGKLECVFVLYKGDKIPVLLGFEDNNIIAAKEFFGQLLYELPKHFYAHLSPDLKDCFNERFQTNSFGRYIKMRLDELKAPKDTETTELRTLGEIDKSATKEFLDESYPGNWLNTRMLETGHYKGAYFDNRLAAVAGIHVYSAKYRVAALGNVATHPDYRRRGLGSLVTHALCEKLLKSVDAVGLNVAESNDHAIKCYENIGFSKHTVYEEFEVIRN